MAIHIVDTSVLLWLNSDPGRLSQPVRALFESDDNAYLISLASVWEMQIKVQIAKLKLPGDRASVHHFVEGIIDTQPNFGLLPIRKEHIYALADLPLHHRDPFDRLLIAQAKSENLPIISADDVFSGYSVQVTW